MVELAVYDSQGNYVAGRDFRGGGKMAEKGFFAGLKFYANVQNNRIKYHCFFRGREHSGARAEQYFVEYKGNTEEFMLSKAGSEEKDEGFTARTG